MRIHQLLRRHIRGRSDNNAGHRHRGHYAVRKFRYAEIGQHRCAVLGEQDIVRLDVTVDDSVPVHHVKGGGNPHGYVYGIGGRDSSALLDHVGKAAPGHIFHDNIAQSGIRILSEVIHGHQIFVPDLSRKLGFAREAAAQLVGHFVWVHHLNGKLRPLGGPDKIDRPHTALSEQFFHHVVAKAVSRLERIYAMIIRHMTSPLFVTCPSARKKTNTRPDDAENRQGSQNPRHDSFKQTNSSPSG